MKLTGIPVCLAQGHVWGESHQFPGFETCRRCRQRRRAPRSSGAAGVAGEDGAPGGTPGFLRTVTVAARKGGSGKSTIALQVAIAAHLRGHKVLLADTDSQQSSMESLSARDGDRLECVAAVGSTLPALKARAAASGVRYLIIDTPGGPGTDLSQAMAISDLNLLVARPSFLDIAAAARTFNEARTLNRPALIVLNQAPPARGGEESAAAAKALEALRYTRLPVSQVIVHARAVFQKAAAMGRSVEELGASAAAEEAAALWREVEALLAQDHRLSRFIDAALAVATDEPERAAAKSEVGASEATPG